MEYLKSKGLGGVMFWEYCADRKNELQQAISKGLVK
jgi:GH18 family chitinase